MNSLVRPPWFVSEDEETLTQSWRALKKADAILPDDIEFLGDDDPAYLKWTAMIDKGCNAARRRYCLHWRSSDGRDGNCEGPELAVGVTKAGDLCEQYEQYPEEV